MDEKRTTRALIKKNNTSKDMAVFTQAKKLSEYIFIITEKSPKKLRWSIVSRLQDSSIALIENLYRANLERNEQRREYQKRAYVELSLVDHFALTAKNMKAINNHQMEVMAKHIADVRKLLLGWARATQKAEEKEKRQN